MAKAKMYGIAKLTRKVEAPVWRKRGKGVPDGRKKKKS